MGSGKTSAGRYLATKYGFQYIRYSQVLEDWTDPASDKSRLQEIGWEVMNGGMQLELNSQLIVRLDQTHSAAIDGLRHQIDYKSLSTTFEPNFALIFISSPESTRFERLRQRFITFDAFRAAEGKPVESCIDELESFAVRAMLNDGSLEQLYHQLDSWLEAPK